MTSNLLLNHRMLRLVDVGRLDLDLTVISFFSAARRQPARLASEREGKSVRARRKRCIAKRSEFLAADI